MKYSAVATLALAAAVSAQNSTTSAAATDCVSKYNVCRQPTNGVSANQAACASSYASCLGENPFASNGTNTIIPYTATASSSAPTATSTGKQCAFSLPAGKYVTHSEIKNSNGEYYGLINRNTTTTITFDIPESNKGKTCKTYLSIPQTKDVSNTAGYDLTLVDGARITVANGDALSTITPAAGNAYLLASGECGKQSKITLGTGDSLSFKWYNSADACPLGAFVVVS